MTKLSGPLKRTREYFESQLKQYLDEDHDDPDLLRMIDDGLAVCDALPQLLAIIERMEGECEQ